MSCPEGWHLKSVRRLSGLPDVPEVRAYMRAAWMRGFTLSAWPSAARMARYRSAAFAAVDKEARKNFPVP